MACQHVPNEVMTDKNKYVRSIVTSAKELNDDPKFNAVCDVVMSCTEFASRPSGIDWTALQSLSISSGVAFTAFVTPPVTQCIVPQCTGYVRSGSLLRHHPPATVTVFRTCGPIPATKINLKCKFCHTVYNYSMYGKRNTEGERYYDNEREFVEVSDAT